MFNKFFGKKTKIIIPELIPDETDYSFGNNVATKAAKLLTEGNHTLLIEHYDLASIHDKTMILNKCCLTEQFGPAIETWSLNSSSNFHSNLFHAVYLTYKAWQARSAAYAKDVSEDQANAFYEYLEEAYNLLVECSELRDDEPEVYSRLIRICTGLGEAGLAEEYFESLTRLAEDHIGGYMFMYNLLTPKWLGSEDDMMEFSGMVYNQTVRYPLLSIITLMHMAECYYIWSDEDKQAAVKRCQQQLLPNIEKQKKQLTGVQLHPAYQNLMNNYFAFLFHVCGQVEDRNKEINCLNPNIPLYPWGYIGISSSQQFWKYQW